MFRRHVQGPRAGLIVLACAGVVAGCGDIGAGDDDGRSAEAAPGTGATDMVDRSHVEHEIEAALGRVRVLADSVDALFRPVPLLTPAQEAAFRRFSNADQLARARALGVRAADAGARAAAVADGRLVRLEDSTAHWVLRELAHSEPLVTPDARRLLVRIGERFQERLARMGVPAYRLEVTSVLRTAESQAELRRTNPNAAAGESAHEYGTTLDVAYASFAAPAELPVATATGEMAWLAGPLEPVAAAVLESVAARNSRELQAVLGHIMTELQDEGLAMVTLERQQPVFHFTVARRIADARATAGDE